MFNTLPRQLFVYLVPGMLLVLTVAGLYLDQLVDDQLNDFFDTTLEAKARSIVALSEQDEDGVELEVSDVALPLYSQAIDPDYFHMLNSSGETLFVSPSATGFTESLPASYSGTIEGLPETIATQTANESSLYYFDHELPDGRRGRWVAVSYYPRIDSDDDDERVIESPKGLVLEPSETDDPGAVGMVMANGVLIAPERVLTFVGTARGALDQLMWAIDIILLLTGIVIAAAIVLIAGFGIRRAIAPLDQLGTDIASLDERSLDSRITLSKPMAELDVVVDQFNQLLARLRSAFGRERQFSADVAHELRTPIAEMRSLIEVTSRFPDNKELAETFSSDLLGSTERMQNVVEQLLLLSRTDQDTFDIGESVELVSLVKSIIEKYRNRAATRGMQISFATSQRTLSVNGSRVWPMLLVNVLDNALDHASNEGLIVISIEASCNSFTLSISNPCDDLQEADLALVCDRLWRKDSARSDGSHSGLGLALVAAYTRHLDIVMNPSLELPVGENANDRRFVVTFTGSVFTEPVTSTTTKGEVAGQVQFPTSDVPG